MKVYMFQKIEEMMNDCEYDTHEELFYTEDDAIEYMEYLFEEEIKIIEEIYCYENETAYDYCDITEDKERRIKNIYMEGEFYISFNVYNKQIMRFGK